VTVAPGASVRWVNTGNRKHTATANDKSFDSGLLATGATYTFTFSTAGTYAYYCDVHPDMVATVTVATRGAPKTPTPTPTPPPPLPGDVQIFASTYAPAAVTIAAGSTVRWVNMSPKTHSVTAKDGSFQSPGIPKYKTFSHTFSTPGTYEYYSWGIDENIGLDMVGTVTVTAAPKTPTVPSAPGEVQIVDFDYNPRTLTVASGTSVRFTNSGTARHTVTAVDKSFDSGFLATTDSYKRSFSAPGTYPYFCVIHPEMTGSVVVTDATGSAPPPPPAASPAPPPVPPVSASPGDVRVIDFDYSPRSITVNAGTPVRFVNAGIAPHTVTARDGSFDSGIMTTGDGFRHTFGTLGTFEFFCVIHPEMTGSVAVSDAAGTAPPPAAAAPATPPPSVSAAAGDVRVIDFDYSPRIITVTAGTGVRFVNAGIAPHTVTARDSSFDSGIMTTGVAFRHIFSTPGTYEFFCILHPAMTGSLRVLDATGAAPPAAVVPVAPAGAGPVVGEDPSPGNHAAGVATIDFGFEPKSVTVKPGTEVTWKNVGAAPHTITARDGSYDSGMVLKGASFSRRFETAGTFAYYCTLHPNMEGTVVVSDAVPAPTAESLLANEQSPAPGSGGPPRPQDTSSDTLKHAWMLVWGVTALAGVVGALISVRWPPSS
jgi:plastocyanin